MKDFLHMPSGVSSREIQNGEVAWRSPANIALIKYWGKKASQIPQNASLSFSLKKSLTTTRIKYSPTTATSADIGFTFEGKPVPEFAEKVSRYIHALYPFMPFLKQLNLDIESSNTFPHSSGIASSASAFSALALCFCSIERNLFNKLHDEKLFLQKASYLARLGSGSAARSVYPGISVWGNHPGVPHASDEYAVPLKENIHKNFLALRDAVLIVNPESKKVSSSAGHHLMKDHAFASARFRQAGENMSDLLSVLSSGDFNRFASIVESEALSLHAMMMTSQPSYLLIEPHSLSIIKKIKAFREQKGHQLCFTIDAGPNIHLIYNEEDAKPVRDFIKNELFVYCASEKWIDDCMGKGPQELKQKI